jgi:hypothetical protein
MREPSVKIVDMFEDVICPGDIVADIRNQRLEYFIPVDFSEDHEKIVLHCKSSGYKYEGTMKYGNKNIKLQKGKKNEIEMYGYFVITEKYCRKWKADDNGLIELHNKTQDWPVASQSKSKTQKPFMDKWIRSLKSGLERELKRVDSTTSRHRYSRSVCFTTSHSGSNTYTHLEIKRSNQSITIRIKDGGGYYSGTLASYSTNSSSTDLFIIDSLEPFKDNRFLALIEKFAKENGIKI